VSAKASLHNKDLYRLLTIKVLPQQRIVAGQPG